MPNNIFDPGIRVFENDLMVVDQQNNDNFQLLGDLLQLLDLHLWWVEDVQINV